MHVNVRTILHDVRAMLSQARSPEIKISQKTPPESFLRRADPKKKRKKKERGKPYRSCVDGLDAPL